MWIASVAVRVRVGASCDDEMMVMVPMTTDLGRRVARVRGSAGQTWLREEGGGRWEEEEDVLTRLTTSVVKCRVQEEVT
jgi:hypothetical protein